MRRPLRVVAALATSVALLVGGLSQAAWADDLSHKRSQLESQAAANKQQQQSLQASIEDMSGQLAQTEQDLVTIQTQLQAAQQKLADATTALATAQREQQQIAGQLTDAQNQQQQIAQQITDGQAQQAQLRDAVGAMAREAYRDGGDVAGISTVLAAQSTDDFLNTYTMLAAAQRAQAGVFDQITELQAQARNQSARMQSVQQKIAELKQAADQKVADANQARQDAADATAQVANLQQQAQTKQASLQGQISTAQQQDAALQASTAQIESDLKKVIAQQQAQAALQHSSAAPGHALPGAWFANPTANNPIYVTSEFGWRLQPVLHIWRLHAGIDLMDHCGQEVRAGRDGTVVWAKYLNGYGNQVMLDHGWVNGTSLMSSYSHMIRFIVSPGQHVTAGQVLGYAGMTGGDSTGCHLHFEVHINGSPVNPRSYLGLPPA